MPELDSIDPILAVLDYLDAYRRSWRCWLIGGPAAVDDLVIGSTAQDTAFQVSADFEHEQVDQIGKHVLRLLRHRVHWYRKPQPRPPAPGEFINKRQLFPLEDTAVSSLCIYCMGTGKRICPTCKGKGTIPCRHCGGKGCSECTEQHGIQECPECGGHRQVRCRCGEKRSALVLLYEVACYTYRHTCVLQESLPEGACKATAPLFEKAWQLGECHTAFHAETLAALQNASLTVLPDPMLQEKLSQACSQLLENAANSSRNRSLFQRLQAQVTQTGSASLRLGVRYWQFWAAGNRRHWLNTLVVTGNYNVRRLSVLQSVFIAQMVLLPQIISDLINRNYTDRVYRSAFYLLLLFVFALLLLLDHITAHNLRFVRRILVSNCKYALRSLRAKPLPHLVIVGPDPAASARFYTLFAHLAAFAQLADPAQGGMACDDTYPELSAMLFAESPKPKYSSTCRIRFGKALPLLQARLVHLYYPQEQLPDTLCRRSLERAAQVWLVLPTAMEEQEVDDYVEEILAHCGKARITLVLDGKEEARALSPALMERVEHVVRMNGATLRERYLAGKLSAAEAAAWVRALISGEGHTSPERQQETIGQKDYRPLRQASR